MPKTPWDDTTNITYYDAEGNPLASSAGAAEAEIVETVNGIEIRRTYLTRDTGDTPRWQPPGDAIGEPDAADNTKNTWDVYLHRADGQLTLVDSLGDLFAALGWDRLPEDEQRANLRRMRKLPSWTAAPERLRNQADSWLGD